MPLITVCGNPATGKTTFANKLAAFLREHGVATVEVINEESLGLSKRECYASSFNEKKIRGTIKGAVDHRLNAERWIIVDSLNYIKGFRYELYCTARSFRTPHCVVWVECPTEISNHWNSSTMNGSAPREPYETAAMIDLRKRFEAPIESNRWDHPLFKVYAGKEVLSSAGTLQEAPVEVVATTVFDGLKINDVDAAATTTKTTAATDTPSSVAPAPTVVKSSWKPQAKPATSSWRPKKNNTSATADAAAAVPDSVIEDVGEATQEPGTGNKEETMLNFSGTAVVRDSNLLDSFRSAEDILPLVHEYLSAAAPARQSAATVSKMHGNADKLFELDSVSKKVVQFIMSHQADNAPGTPIKFLEFEREIVLHRHTAQAELNRHRAQFVKMHGKQPPDSAAAIGAAFIDFLALHI